MITLLKVVALAAVTYAKTTPRVSEISNFPDGRIIGGENALLEQVTHQVSINIYGQHYCGGSIIAKDWILTAAHCARLPKEYYTIRAGSLYAQNGGTLHQVILIIAHENYTMNELGIPSTDIALFRISKSFVFDNYRRAIELFKKNEEIPVGTSSVVTGWGTVSSSDQIFPPQLQTVTIPIISTKNCAETYRVIADINDSQICAIYSGGGKDSCQGDSGGPMVVGGRLAGVVSWGYGCASPYFPGVYTKVSYYRDWIDNSMKSCSQSLQSMLRSCIISIMLITIVQKLI